MWQPQLVAICVLAIAVAGPLRFAQALDCYTCNSAENAACGSLRNHTVGGTELPSRTCAIGVTACSVQITSSGHIQRGCEAAPQQCTGDRCSACTSDKCNGERYPTNGLQCLQCAGAECASGVQTALPCPRHAVPDTCYSAFSKDGQTIYRGCLAADQRSTGGELCNTLGSLCVKCSRNGCNTAQPIIQDNPLACVKCNSLSDPDCAALTNNPASENCELISNGQTDACYVRVRNGTVERGCLSERFDLEQSDCNGQTVGGRCSLCTSGAGCNRQAVVAERCLECDSEVDATCATGGVSDLRQTVCPLSAGPMGCYRFQDEAGRGTGEYGDIVKRGCVSSLHDAEAAMCARSASGCKHCSGDNCNAKPHFQTCFNCTSAQDLRCYLNATATQRIECASFTDNCYTQVVDNTVSRGCAAEGPANLAEECSDPATCELCDAEQNCNATPVGADDYCYTCDSRVDANCRDQVDDSMREQCAFSVQTLGCFRAEDEDGHVRRGCLNSVRNATEVAQCRSQSDTCKTCSGPFCNAKPSFQRCRVCNSTDSGACIRSPGSFASQLCPDYMDECFTHVDADVVTRGCVSSIQTDALRTECAADSDELCATCSAGGASCNNQLVDGEFCYECDSTSGTNCGSGANFTMRKQCPLGVGRRGCYLFDDNGGTVKRGCVADLVAAERQMCRRPGGDTCKTCVGNDCNAKQTFQRCRHCDSRATVNCVRAAHVTEAVLCERYDDECFVHIDANSTVTRGCLQQHASGHEQILEACADVAIDTCETCSAPGAPCNQRLVDGEFCMRCDSAVDPSCGGQAQNHTARVQCPLSPIRRGCYHSVAEDGRVQRGCLADLPAAEIDECREDGAVCKSCMGDDCNGLAEFRRCRSCNSVSSVNCIRSPNAFASVTCMRYLDQCYTHVADDVVYRGCVMDWPSPLAIKVDCGSNNTEWCQTCSDGQSCNNRIVDGEFCLTCDSEQTADCRTNQNYTMRTQCPLSVGQRGCYLFDDFGGVVKRGCVADLVADERRMCDGQGDSCKTCLGNDCNQKTKYQSCRTCNSAQSVNCIRSPQAFAAEQCRHYDDQCITHVRNNTVTRGCRRLVMNELARDDCSGPADTEHCTRCERSDGGSCNTAVVDGEFCLTCDSATDPNCRANLNHTMRTQCPLSAQPRGCFRLDGADGHVRRGCVADLDEPAIAECREEGDSCKTCVGNDCNAKVAFQQCRVCSSETSVNCIRSPGSFASQTCRSYTDECFVHVHDNVVTRGCLAEAATPPAVRDECRNGDGEMCQSCATGANCNNRVVDGEFCLACDSRLDANCGGGGLNFTMREQCPLSVLARGCYLNAGADGNVTRGCVAQLPAAERLACREEGDQCKTCRGNDCNAKVAFEYCRTCSSASSVNCIRSPGAFAALQCRGYTDECYTHVRDNVVTRGCLAQNNSTALQTDCSDANANPEFCQKCSGTRGCNNRLVDGEFCLTCDSSADPNCLANANFTMRTQCPLAVRPRGCYRHAYADGRVERGCVADIASPAEAEQCGRPGDVACKTCVGNDCNQEAGFAQCKQCSSVTDVDCFRGPKWVDSVTCPEYLDTCFFHVQNNTATRGCRSNATEPAVSVDCAENGELCALCRGADCNDQLLDGEFCLHCDSATDPNCRQAADWSMRKQCDLSVQRRGCYRFDDGAGAVRRGCVSDIGADAVTQCRQQGDQCKTCTGDDCNAKQTFQTCRVCNSTQSASCIRSPGAFASQTCREYDDVCYSHAVADVVTRGCLAAAPVEVRETCATNPALCETCTGLGCNNKLVDGEFCMRCDSRVDANCRENLDHTLRVQCPLAVTQRGCYRQEVADGHVLRGCVADFNATEAESCEADGAKCKTCIGNDCNAKVHFQQCKVCNSTENVDCIRHAAGWVDTVLCDRYTDECVTHVFNNVTVRGCAAEQSLGVQNDCHSNPDLCAKCTGGRDGEACNAQIVDGEFCLTCDSTVDPHCRLQASIGMRTQCSLSVTPLGCFHRANENNSVVRRGCISDLSAVGKAECRADAAHCKICRGNDCNQRPEFPRCLTCDSSSDPNCAAARNGSTAAIITTAVDCADYTDDCYTHLNGSHVRRGCVLEAEHVADIRSECTRDERNCRLCRGADCNQINVEPESCWECDSERQGVDCVEDLVHAKRCSAESDYSFDRRGCFHQVYANSTAVRRGCVRHLERDEQLHCATQTDCKTCQGDNCNERREFQRCHKCGFLYDDANCADNTTAAMQSGTCNLYENSCSTYILSGGATVRGCTRDLRNLNEVQQSECTGNDCNGAVFPADRLRCHQCAGAECSDEQADQSATACRHYRPDDQCYGYLNASNHMVRGCVSDTDEKRERCDASGTQCVRCATAGCNAGPSFREPTLACVKCAGTDACEWAWDPEEAESCRKPVAYGRFESCYTKHSTASTQRGCTNDVGTVPDYGCSEGSKCTWCTSSACNVKNAVWQVCQVCNSSAVGQAVCAEKDLIGYAEECPATKYAERGCFTRNDGGIITRGCFASLSTEQRTECADSEHANKCEVCTQPDCNTKAPPSAALSMRSLSVLTLVLAALVVVLLQ